MGKGSGGERDSTEKMNSIMFLGGGDVNIRGMGMHSYNLGSLFAPASTCPLLLPFSTFSTSQSPPACFRGSPPHLFSLPLFPAPCFCRRAMYPASMDLSHIMWLFIPAYPWFILPSPLVSHPSNSYSILCADHSRWLVHHLLSPLVDPPRPQLASLHGWMETL